MPVRRDVWSSSNLFAILLTTRDTESDTDNKALVCVCLDDILPT